MDFYGFEENAIICFLGTTFLCHQEIIVYQFIPVELHGESLRKKQKVNTTTIESFI